MAVTIFKLNTCVLFISEELAHTKYKVQPPSCTNDVNGTSLLQSLSS